MSKKRWILAGMLAGSAMLLSSCALLPQEEAVRTAPLIREFAKEAYKTEVVRRGDLVRTERVSARYVPVLKQALAFPITGEQVDRMLVEVGDEVQAGQLLGQQMVESIENSIEDCQTSIEELELRLAHQDALLEIELQRTEIRYAKQGAAALRDALAEAEGRFAADRKAIEDALTVDRMQLADLQAKLAQRQLYAPFAGTVTYVRKYDQGHRSAYAETAVTLADSTVTLFRAETKHWAAFRPGDLYDVEVDDMPYTLKVTDEADLNLPPQEKKPDKAAYVYFILTEPAPALEEGDNCVINIELERRDDVLYVPSDAVISAGERTIVYYQTAEGIKAYKDVTVGATIAGYTEILSGLVEGEEIIAG